MGRDGAHDYPAEPHNQQPSSCQSYMRPSYSVNLLRLINQRGSCKVLPRFMADERHPA